MNDNIVEVKNINMNFYTKEGELEVLKDVNFNLKEGEILTLLGPSGSGKSTILNILTNLLKPTSGDIKITGNIGYMFQKDNLLEWRNIMDNITIGLEIQGKKDKKSLDRVESLLKTYGLWDFRSMYPKELSGGMRQRVALIRTLSVNPDILLLDEPFSALDYQTRLLVCDDVYSIIKNENKSTILVTHDIGEARCIKVQHKRWNLYSIYKNKQNDYILFHTNNDKSIEMSILEMFSEYSKQDRYYNNILNQFNNGVFCKVT